MSNTHSGFFRCGDCGANIERECVACATKALAADNARLRERVAELEDQQHRTGCATGTDAEEPAYWSDGTGMIIWSDHL